MAQHIADGHCAFSRSCVHAGPLERLQGTNLEFCHSHFVQVQSAPLHYESGANEFARVSFRAPGTRRRTSRWMAGGGL